MKDCMVLPAAEQADGSIKMAKKYPVFYTKGEEIFNAVTHIVGGAFGLIITILLPILARGNSVHAAATAVFGVSVLILYTMSALYHFLPVGRGKAVFRIFDHCTIYLLIAGTYTPFCLIALEGTPLGLTVLICEWTLAVAGIIMNAIAMNNKVIKIISMILYVAMGWFVCVAFSAVVAAISSACFWFLLGGGIAYTLGIIFFALAMKVKYFHSVWHLFDLLGTALQFVSVLFLII